MPAATDAPGELAVACCDGAIIHVGNKPKYLKNKADKAGWYEVRAARHDGILNQTWTQYFVPTA